MPTETTTLVPGGRELRAESAGVFLEPRSVAIIGVSSGTGDAYKAGGRAVLDHLKIYGFEGMVAVVHPTVSEIDGAAAYPSIARLPFVPGVLVIAVPAARVLDVLREAAAVGIRRALILTGGFSDMGHEGAALEAGILDFARQAGIDIVGPNSTGLVNVATGLAMSMTSVLTEGVPIPLGRMAVIAQSGAIGSTVVERARVAGVGISHIVSTGNQRDMDIPDFLSYFARADGVDVVALYIESVRNGELFSRAVRELNARGKRVIAYLGGRNAAGEIAAASHTGKIVGRGALELALLRSLGVIVVDDPDDIWMLGGSDLDARLPLDWGMVAYSGGMAVLATEQLASAGVRFPALSEVTADAVRRKLPQFADVHNPLDVGPGSMPKDFRDFLSALATDDAVRVVCVPLPMGARGWNQQSVDDILAIRDLAGKPFVVLWYGGEALQPYIRQLRAAGILVAEQPSDLGRLVAPMLRGSESSADAEPRSAEVSDPTIPSRASLGGAGALDRLRAAHVDVAAMRVCGNNADDVLVAARQIGYPVVIKSGGGEIAHRAELGLVTTQVADDAGVRAALESMNANADRAGLSDHRSWIVQEMVGKGLELVIRVQRAGSLGVFGTVGLGGLAVEVTRDVVSLPLPIGLLELKSALRELRTGPLLFGFRGSEPVDIAWVHATLLHLADLLESDPGLAEVEINPAIVRGQGGTVVDALLVPASRE